MEFFIPGLSLFVITLFVCYFTVPKITPLIAAILSIVFCMDGWHFSISLRTNKAATMAPATAPGTGTKACFGRPVKARKWLVKSLAGRFFALLPGTGRGFGGRARMGLLFCSLGIKTGLFESIAQIHETRLGLLEPALVKCSFDIDNIRAHF